MRINFRLIKKELNGLKEILEREKFEEEGEGFVQKGQGFQC